MRENTTEQDGRDDSGRWKRGQSGNPGGRPRGEGHVRDLAKRHTEEAIEALVGVLRNSTNDRARLQAAETILSRAWGKPAQDMSISFKGRTVDDLTEQELESLLGYDTGEEPRAS
jgi:ribonuclease HI